jgi:Putative transposase/Transposase zinc-binding domain
MSGLTGIVAGHGRQYLDKFGDRMLPSHRRVLADILACRTEAMGGHVCECEECGHQHYTYHSCKNRSCPACHSGDTKKWLAKRETELLPIRHFHVVFTIPAELRDIVRSNQKKLYAVLIRASVDTLQKIGLDPKFVGGRLSMLTVLHTWTRALEFHPHVHMLVPGGGLDKDGVWRCARKKFLVPVQALSRMFRARFMKLARKALPQESFPKEVWGKEWVVFCKPTFNRAKKVLRYLGRYVHRIAITNNRILATKDGNVTFCYQESKSGAWKTMTLSGGEFLRRYLQHVLPQGFHKVRYYGMLSPANRATLKRVQLLLTERSRNKEGNRQEAEQGSPWNICPCCKEGVMVIISWLPRRSRSPPNEGQV